MARFSRAELAAAKKNLAVKRERTAAAEETQKSLNAAPEPVAPAAQIKKQMTKANRSANLSTPISENVNHAAAMSSLADDLSARIHHAASGDPQQAEMLTAANSHVNDALKYIGNHSAAHAAGNVKGALGYLTAAGIHLSSAANSLPQKWSGKLLSDNLSFSKVPWRVPEKENPAEHAGFVSLENIHNKINDIVDAYKGHVATTGAEIPKEVQKLPRVSEETRVPISGSVVEPRYTQSESLDAEARRVQREAANKPVPENLADHFAAGSDHGRQ